MITNITLENFKCFRKVEVNPRRITVFVGPNGTGKSSVLQAMALLKQSVGSPRLNVRGVFVNLQSSDQLQPNFDARSERLRIGFSGGYERPLQPQQATSAEIEEWEAMKDVGFWYNRQLEGDDFKVVPPDAVTRNVANYTLQRLKFVPAIRGLVRPSYALGEQRTEDISQINGLGEQEQQTATNLVYSRHLEETISSLSKRVTGVGVRANPIPSQSVEVLALASAGSVNMALEGFGTNALILLFLQLASAEKGATVMIEEPEIHLHPKAQAELASVLVEEAQAEDKQIIMTTHSEHIVGRLLTLVAEKKLSVDELAIYAFEKDDKGECSASQLEVTADGKVQGGVKDFFETDLAELDRYIRAMKPTE